MLGTIAFIVSLAATANAGTPYYWFGDNSVLGGAGTWSTTAGADTWWGTTPDAADTSAWTNSLTYDAYFQGAASGTITVNSSVTQAGNLYFNTNGYVLTGGDVTLPQNASVTVADGCTATIDSVLRNGDGSNPASFTKLGTGTLVLGARDYLARGNATDKSIYVREGKLVIKGASPYGYTNSPTKLYEGATLDMYGVTDSTGTNQSYGGTWTSSYPGSWTYGKPWNINSGYNFTVLAGPSQYIAWSNSIIGPGSLTTQGNGNGYAAGLVNGRLQFSTLSNTGGTVITNGVVSTQWDAVGSTMKLGTGNLTLSNGVLAVQATAAGVSATFTRSLGSAAGEVQWVGDGGFGALSTNAPTLTVNIGGAGDQLAWGQQYFVQTGSKLVFGGADLNNSNAVSTVVWVNPINLGNATRTIDVESVKTDQYAAVARMDGILSGTGGGLTKTGAGTLKLTAENTYTGDTSVLAGLLQIDHAYLSDWADVLIADGAKLNLNFSDTDVVGGLSLGGVWQTALGTYGSTASGADFQSDVYFSGTGKLQLVPEPGTIALLAAFSLLGLLAYAWRKHR